MPGWDDVRDWFRNRRFTGRLCSVVILATGLLGSFGPTNTFASSPSADLTVTMTGPATVRPDTDVTYSISFTNNGPDPVSGMELLDTLPAGLSFKNVTFGPGMATYGFFCNIPVTFRCDNLNPVPSGGTASLELVAHVDASVADGTQIVNTANVVDNPGTDDPNTADNSSSVTTTVLFPRADLAVTMTGPATARPDTDVTYSISFTNNGPDPVSGMELLDTLPAGLSFKNVTFGPGMATYGFFCNIPVTFRCDNLHPVPSGGTASLDLVAHVDASLADGTQIVNTAKVVDNPGTIDPNSADNSATVTTTVLFPRADLAVTMTGPATARPDTDVTYSISFTNNGPDPVSGMELLDTLPAGLSFKNVTFGPGMATYGFFCNIPVTFRCDNLHPVPSGGTASLDLVAHVDAALADGTQIVNTAKVVDNPGTVDPNSADNSATVTTTVLFPRADLAVTMTGPATARPDTDVTYSISFTNNGPDSVSGMELLDTLPAGLSFKNVTFGAGMGTYGFFCNIPVTFRCDNLHPVPSGGTASLDLVAHVDASLADGTQIVNTANVVDNPGTVDPNTADNSASVTTTVVVLNAAAGGPYAGPEGSAIPVQGTITGAGGAAVTTTWSVAPGAGVDAGATCSFANASALATTVTCTDDGTYTLTLTAAVAGGPTKTATAQLTVGNVKPSLTITAPTAGSLFAIPATVSLQSSFTDPGTNDTQTCSVNWDDGSALEVFAAAGNACNRTHTFSVAGVYTIAVTVTDDDGGAGSAGTFAVVYDGSAGFVTGGGFIDSPAGAYPADRTLVGRATFGFVSRYAKGATTPTGETEFQFQAAAFNFHSTSYDWLVVAGARAQFKGSGTVNGAAGYAFLLTATDGQVTGGGGVDRLRLKVWSSATGTVVYDNVLGAGDDLDTASPQAVSGGSIVIHR